MRPTLIFRLFLLSVLLTSSIACKREQPEYPPPGSWRIPRNAQDQQQPAIDTNSEKPPEYTGTKDEQPSDVKVSGVVPDIRKVVVKNLPPKTNFLSDLSLTNPGSTNFSKDKTYELLTPLMVGDRIYQKGISIQAYFAANYDLRGEYKTFTAIVGLYEDENRFYEKHPGSVVLIISGDGKELYKSNVITSLTEPKMISIPIEGVHHFIIEVKDAGDGNSCDILQIVDAKVTQ